MKKAIALILTLVLVVGVCCMPAMASRTGTDDPTSNTDVDVNIKLNDNIKHKYCVDIDYPTQLVFTFTKNGEWDPNSYTYTGESEGWSDPASIKVTNHSDLPVKYSVTDVVTNQAFSSALDIVLTNQAGTIEACTVGTADGSKNASFTVGISGTPGNALTSTEVTLGKITISITKP